MKKDKRVLIIFKGDFTADNKVTKQLSESKFIALAVPDKKAEFSITVLSFDENDILQINKL